MDANKLLNIWLVQIGEPLPLNSGIRKQRLSMLAETLAKRGHKVTRWASEFDHLTKRTVSVKPEIEQSGDLKIKLLRGCGYRKNISLKRYMDHRLLAVDFRHKAARMPKPDIILVATPPHNIAYTVVKYGRCNNVPVIVDIRDQWPDIFFVGLSKMLKNVCRRLFFKDFLEIEKALSGADAITAVSKDFLEWGLHYAGREISSLDRVFYIGTDKIDDADGSNVRPELEDVIRRAKGKLILTFVGSFGELQNPLILIEAARRFEKEDARVFFVISGNGVYMDKVKEKAQGLSNVALTGWLRQEEIMYLLKNSDVGVCPLNKDIPLFPNKVFMYFSAFVPVIASARGELAGLMRDREIGFYFRPGDVDELCDRIKKFSDDRALGTKMSENVKACFFSLFDAKVIYGNFCSHIEELARIKMARG